MSLPDAGRLDPKRVVLLTGASSGIGLALAERAARGGFDVVAVGRRVERLERLQYDVEGAIGHVLTIALDITEHGAPETIVHAALHRFGRIDILVNNAGGVASGSISEQLDADLREQVDTHIVAPLALLRESLPSLKERRGHVFFVGSGVARIPVSSLGAYPAAKAAVRNLTRVVRNDLRPHGIAVTYIDPGAVATEFMTRAGFEGPPALLAASPVSVARRIYAAFDTRPDVVNGVPWQTTFVALGEALPTVTDWVLSHAPGIVGGNTNVPPPLPTYAEGRVAPLATLPSPIPPPAIDAIEASPFPKPAPESSLDGHGAAAASPEITTAPEPPANLASSEEPVEASASSGSSRFRLSPTLPIEPPVRANIEISPPPSSEAEDPATEVEAPAGVAETPDVSEAPSVPAQAAAAIAEPPAAVDEEPAVVSDVPPAIEDPPFVPESRPVIEDAKPEVEEPVVSIVPDSVPPAVDLGRSLPSLPTAPRTTNLPPAPPADQARWFEPDPVAEATVDAIPGFTTTSDVPAAVELPPASSTVKTEAPETEPATTALEPVLPSVAWMEAAPSAAKPTFAARIGRIFGRKDPKLPPEASPETDSLQTPFPQPEIAPADQSATVAPTQHETAHEAIEAPIVAAAVGTVAAEILSHEHVRDHEPSPEPEHAVAAEPAHIAAAEPEHIAATEPEHIAATEPEPIAAAEPEPIAAAEPEHTAAAEPEHIAAAEPEHIAAAEPEHAAAAEPEPEPVFSVEPVHEEPIFGQTSHGSSTEPSSAALSEEQPPFDATDIWRRPATSPEAGANPWSSRTTPWLPPAVEHAGSAMQGAPADGSAEPEPSTEIVWTQPVIPDYHDLAPAIVVDDPVPDETATIPHDPLPFLPEIPIEPIVMPDAESDGSEVVDSHDDYSPEAMSEESTSYERALAGVARRMKKLNLSHHFLARLLVPGDVLFTGDVALRWAGMPNKNERSLTAEALLALADAGYLERLEDERYRVLRSARE